MLFAFSAFWVLLVLGRDELGLGGVGAAIAAWTVILVGTLVIGRPGLFGSALALLDIVLVLEVFKLSQWAWINVFQFVCRLCSGAGSIPFCFKMLPTVASEIV